MEIIKYSNETIGREFLNCKTLQDIIAHIEGDLRTQGRVLIKISVNGLPMSEEDEQRFSQTGINDIQSIEIQTEAESKILQSSMDTTQEFLQNLKVRSLNVAERFRNRPEPADRHTFVDLVNYCQLLTQALVTLRPHLETQNSDFSHEQWKSSEEKFLATMRELVLAYEANDRTLVSDVLEYELSNALDQWLDFITKSH